MYKEIRINLSVPCFSHGHLYVGVSWTRSAEKESTLTLNNQTCDILYPEGLLNWSLSLNIETVSVYMLHRAN